MRHMLANMYRDTKQEIKILQCRFDFVFSVIVLDPVCFDGLELFLVYKLQYKEAAPDGNGVYFCSK